MEKIIIKGGTFINIDDKIDIIKNGTMIIEGNKIKKIYDHNVDMAMLEKEKPYQIIEAQGKVILPGFVNAHGHAAMTLLRSYADDLPLMEWLEKRIWPLEANLEEDDVYYGTLLSMIEMLKGGTTTFTDMYFFMNKVAEATVESGIRAVLSRGMVGIGEQSEKAIVESEDFFKNWHGEGEGRVSVMLGPHAPYTCPPDYLKRVMELRDKLKVPIQIHLAETEWEVNYCSEEFGKTPIELMDSIGLFKGETLAAHCVHLTPGDIEILAENKVRVAHNPGSNLKLGSGIAPLPELLDAGVIVGLGTDGAASNNNLDMLEEIRLAALIHKGVNKNPLLVPAETALKMATVNGGKAVFNENIGLLKEGKLADLIIFDYQGKSHLTPGHNPISDIVYSAQSGDIDTVIVNGNIVVEKGNCKFLDEEKIIYEAKLRGFGLDKKQKEIKI